MSGIEPEKNIIGGAGKFDLAGRRRWNGWFLHLCRSQYAGSNAQMPAGISGAFIFADC